MADDARWIDKDGKALSCKDKLSTLEENLEELLDIALDALEDAAVMGVDTNAARQVFLDEIAALKPRFAGTTDTTNQSGDAAGIVAQSSRSES